MKLKTTEQFKPVQIILFIFLGLISGLIGGLLGIGGGVIVVPALYYLFKEYGVHSENLMQIAISTSLATGFITSASSSIFQLIRKAISFNILKYLVPGLLIGAIIGANIAHLLSSNLLSAIFGVIAILLGIYFCFPKLRFYIAEKPNFTLNFFSPFVGLLSSLLGIGGGVITFPILLGYQIHVKQASGNSSAVTVFSTLFGSLAFIWITKDQPSIPSKFGYIDIPALIAIGISSFVSAPLGVRLAHILNVNLIKRIFGVCLALIGLSMLTRTFLKV